MYINKLNQIFHNLDKMVNYKKLTYTKMYKEYVFLHAPDISTI
jgi:hypothetical protein